MADAAARSLQYEYKSVSCIWLINTNFCMSPCAFSTSGQWVGWKIALNIVVWSSGRFCSLDPHGQWFGSPRSIIRNNCCYATTFRCFCIELQTTRPKDKSAQDNSSLKKSAKTTRPRSSLISEDNCPNRPNFRRPLGPWKSDQAPLNVLK